MSKLHATRTRKAPRAAAELGVAVSLYPASTYVNTLAGPARRCKGTRNLRMLRFGTAPPCPGAAMMC